jgi:uncharacterized membrane protein
MERWTERQVELRMARLLRTGVIVSATVMVIGAVIYLVKHGSQWPEYGTFQSEPSDLRSVTGIILDALAGRGRGIMQLAVLLMIATPVLRVAFAVYAFARERDRLYVGVSLVVLALLIYGLIGGS